MTAKQSGKSHWAIEPKTKDQKKFITDQAFQMVLKTIQHAIVHLTNSNQSKRLQALQACTNQLYKQADQCLSQGKRMVVTDVDRWN